MFQIFEKLYLSLIYVKIEINDWDGWSEMAVGNGSRNFDFRPIVSVMSISEARHTENPDFFFRPRLVWKLGKFQRVRT
jgi:hypothetical protein